MQNVVDCSRSGKRLDALGVLVQNGARIVERTPLTSTVGWSTPDRIAVKGFDLPGDNSVRLFLCDMEFLVEYLVDEFFQ